MPEGEFCHYDTPLTVAHEVRALRDGGFRTVQILRQWGQNCTLKAEK